MRIPTEDECRRIFEHYAVPSTVVRHCTKVAEIGTFLARKIREAGQTVDVPLVTAGCLLHDAFKAVSLSSLHARPEWGYVPTAREIEGWKQLRERYPGKHETEVAADVLGHDYPQFAAFVAKIGGVQQHSYYQQGMELAIIHYADWRVQLDRVVPFDERLDYLRDAYRHKWIERGEGYWQERLAQEKELEAGLFRFLPFAPEALADALNAAV